MIVSVETHTGKIISGLSDCISGNSTGKIISDPSDCMSDTINAKQADDVSGDKVMSLPRMHFTFSSIRLRDKCPTQFSICRLRSQNSNVHKKVNCKVD